jgi:tryptophan 2,3-dioxygenase
MKPVYYSEYLQLDKILQAQEEESKKAGVRADDEMLFIVIHQAYELWFKQIIHELTIVREVFSKKEINDNSSDITNAYHRLQRIVKIQQVLLQQMDVLETMTPLDFLDFRDFLRPASGFQSMQFKIIEAQLGLPFQSRFGQEYYLSQLKSEDVAIIKKAEQEVPLIKLVNEWLERMPLLKNNGINEEEFWNNYASAYESGLLPNEKANMEGLQLLLLHKENYPAERQLSLAANRSALFIMMYRDYPLLHTPFLVLQSLLAIDEMLAQWRYRHMNMVQRMIGRRVGTGGSTGAAYLKGAADSHYIYKELADLTSYLMPRNRLPQLSEDLVKLLGYENGK